MTVSLGCQSRSLCAELPTVAAGRIRYAYGPHSHIAILHTRVGLTFALGGVFSLIAFVLGLALMRPARARAAALTDTLGSAKTEQERAARTVEIQRLRARVPPWGGW